MNSKCFSISVEYTEYVTDVDVRCQRHITHIHSAHQKLHALEQSTVYNSGLI